MYAKFFKRFLDFALSLTALIVLFPFLVLLVIVNAAAMGGNPFFVQPRPGKKGKDGNEVIFNLIKLRTMTNARDSEGNLLPDDVRLTKWGKFLRSTSLDELPELINIVKGDMSIVGPRPLLVKYLPLYSEEQRHRHDVRPGLTGWAQVNGRNLLSWEERFAHDVWYTRHVSMALDLKVLWLTVKCVLVREGVSAENAATMDAFTGNKEQVNV